MPRPRLNRTAIATPVPNVARDRHIAPRVALLEASQAFDYRTTQRTGYDPPSENTSAALHFRYPRAASAATPYIHIYKVSPSQTPRRPLLLEYPSPLPLRVSTEKFPDQSDWKIFRQLQGGLDTSFVP